MRNTEVAIRQYKEQETVKLYTVEEVTDIFKRKLEQKVCGFGLVVIGLLSTAILKDGTFACFIVPIGIYAVLTKNDMSGD